MGVNQYVSDEKPIEILQIDESVRAQQIRTPAQTPRRALQRPRRQHPCANFAVPQREPTISCPYIYEAVKAYATLGEICDALRDVFGTYEEVAVT